MCFDFFVEKPTELPLIPSLPNRLIPQMRTFMFGINLGI